MNALGNILRNLGCAGLGLAWAMNICATAQAQIAPVDVPPMKSLPGAMQPQEPATDADTTPAADDENANVFDPGDGTTPFATDRVLVQVRSGRMAAAAVGEITLPHVTRLVSLAPHQMTVASVDGEAEPEWCVAHLDGSVTVQQAMTDLAMDTGVASVEYDYIRYLPAEIPSPYTFEEDYYPAAASTADPMLSKQYALTKVHASEAWAVNAGNAGVVVAVIDGGVDYNHPDLKSHIWRNSREIENGRDDDGNGYKDDFIGYNFRSENNNVYDDVPSGHGTHVAGIIAAVRNNSVGIAGLANVTIMPLKVFPAKGGARDSDIIAAIEYAVANGADVINMSLGGGSYNSAYERACNRAYSRNVVIVGASGNDGATKVFFPANLSSVIAVGAVDSKDRIAYFSNTGKDLEVVAPGVDILSTLPGGKYGYKNGTSMAAPYAAAVAALIRSAYPGLDADSVRAYLSGTADDLSSTGYDTTYGYGRVNAFRAVKKNGTPVSPPAAASGGIGSSDGAAPCGAGVLGPAGFAMLTLTGASAPRRRRNRQETK